MKTVLCIIIICSGIFFAKTSFAQTEDYFSGYKKRIKLLIETKEYDSIITFSFDQNPDPPPPPAPRPLESLNNRWHYDDAFLVCFRNDSCFAICMTFYDSGIATSYHILIQAKPQIDSLRQFWSKAEGEYFSPFIYKNRKNGKVSYDTLHLLNPAYGNLTFGRIDYYESKDFLPFVTTETVSDYKNINYKHNSSLNLFSIYTILKRFYRSMYEQFVYHK